MIVSLAEVRDQLGLVPSKTDEDAMLTRMIAAEQAWVEARLGGRKLEATAFVLYFSGDGSDTLGLGQGPVQSFASIAEVVYGGAEPAEEPVDPTTFRIIGMASDTGYMPARLVLDPGLTWVPGTKNYKATFEAGWPTPAPPTPEVPAVWSGPPEIKQLVTDLVVWRRNKRKDVGLRGRDIGVPGSMTFESDAEMVVYVDQILRPYLDAGAL